MYLLLIEVLWGIPFIFTDISRSLEAALTLSTFPVLIRMTSSYGNCESEGRSGKSKPANRICRLRRSWHRSHESNERDTRCWQKSRLFESAKRRPSFKKRVWRLRRPCCIPLVPPPIFLSQAQARTTNPPKAPSPIYKQAKASIESRVQDLLTRMTLEEKVRQLDMYHGSNGRGGRTHGARTAPDAVFLPKKRKPLGIARRGQHPRSLSHTRAGERRPEMGDRTQPARHSGDLH